MDRRTFLRLGGMTAGGFVLGQAPLVKASAHDETVVTVLHTNDTHSQIEPLSAGPNAGRGGIARRATLVKRVRKENPNTVLVDAGDVCQGTPYFNFFRGEVEYKAMSMLGYTAGTIGNHEFDNGVASLTKALSFANFPILSANYDFSGAPGLKRRVRPWTMRNIGGIRVGMFGLGVDFKDLVLPENHVGVSYLDPVETSRRTVKHLREREGADMVVAMSHMGYFKKPDAQGKKQMGDIVVAEQVAGIDFIVGGHSHTFMKEPDVIEGPSDWKTILFQVGYAGINLGRVDFTFRRRKIVAWNGSIVGGGLVFG